MRAVTGPSSAMRSPTPNSAVPENMREGRLPPQVGPRLDGGDLFPSLAPEPLERIAPLD